MQPVVNLRASHTRPAPLDTQNQTVRSSATPLDQLIGHRLGAFRARAKKSLADIREATGIPEADLLRIERQGFAVSASALFVIAKAVGCTLDELFAGVDAVEAAA